MDSVVTNTVYAKQVFIRKENDNAYVDYNHDFLLNKDEIDETINYLENALRKAKALAEGLDNYDTLKR